jgi:RNA polymerase sigma factor (sigma-70 family)
MPTDAPDGTTLRLAQAAQSGDLDAFNQLHEHLAKALLVWVGHRLRTQGRITAHVEDITQATWFAAWTSLSTYEASKGSFRYWLFGIARNRLLKALREAGRTPLAGNQPDPGTTDLDVLGQIPDRVTALVQRVARADDARLLHDHLEGLAEEDRELMVRCGIEGATCRQVAAILNLTEEAVFKRWQRLRERVRTNPRLRDLLD